MISQEMKAINEMQQEVNSLKRRISELESTRKVSAYGKQPPIFGPQNDKTYASPWSDDYEGPNGYFNDPNRPFP